MAPAGYPDLAAALTALGDLLADRGQPFEVVAIGGGALALMGLIDRATKDIDLVALSTADGLISAEPLPHDLQTAIADVASIMQIDPRWMNAEPTGLLRHQLPPGFRDRCRRQQFGALSVLFASRFDQIHLKLLADDHPRSKHHHDLQRLQPTADELVAAARWARTHDSSEGFLLEVRGVLRSFGVELPDD